MSASADSKAVQIREVGVRDGLQSIRTILPTERKIEWIHRAVAAGMREMEIGSFVPPKLMPQLADTGAVLEAANAIEGLMASVLIPNLKGAERALEGNAHSMLLPLSASREHSLANLRRTPDEVIDELKRIRAARDASGRPTLIEVGISTAFGCTIQGDVDPAEVLRLVAAALDAGADEIGLADTVGYADPASVSRLFEQAIRIGGDRIVNGHFHDTRGLALANVNAALGQGIRRFDASLAGIGGCPHAPGASGNVATEDLAFMLESMGLDTGIDLQALLALRADVARWLSGEQTHGTLARAGLPKNFRPARARTDDEGGAVALTAASSAVSFPASSATSSATQSSLNAPSGSASRSLPLEGVRVVEFTHMVMGPTCGMILADLGAEVIKIEPPGGDRTRNLPGLGIGFFRSFNRNKKSVMLDVGTPEGHAQALELIGRSDVVLENFRPGLMAKQGLDHATLSKRFPRLIHVSLKGFLPGPYQNRLALDEVVQNMAGLTYMTGPPGRPLRMGSSVNDIMGGMFGAIGVLAALRERDRTGRGQEIQTSLFENCCVLAAQHIAQFEMTGEIPPPMAARVSAWSVYDIFDLKDGEQLFIGAVSDRQFQSLCRVLDRADLAQDPRLQTNAQRVAMRPQMLVWLGESLKRWHAADLIPKFDAEGVAYAPIVRPDQLLVDEHLLASGGLVDMGTDSGQTAKTVLLPLMMNGRRLGVRHPLPKLGQHNDEVLRTSTREVKA